MSRQWNALGVSHRFIKRHLPKGGFAIDATAGNGGDTLMLCETLGAEGCVLAMDIQEQAVTNTRKLLEENGYAHMVRLVQDSHANLEQYAAPESADCVMFNFGWLPGGDHTVFSTPDTSIAAVTAGLELLRSGGVMSLCIYHGRNNGTAERDALLSFLPTLDNRRYTVIRGDFINRTGDIPIPVFIVKE